MPEFGGEGFIIGLLFGAHFYRVAAHFAKTVRTVEVAALRVGGSGAIESGERALCVGLGDEADDERGDDGLESAGGTGSCGEEVGVGDAGVNDDAHRVRVGALETAVEFESEEKVRELGAAVGGPGFVVVLPVEVVKVHGGSAVRDGADGDDARRHGRIGLKDRGEQEAGEGEVAEMVGAELELESVGGEAAFGQGHYAGVVDEQVEAAVRRKEGFRGGADGGKAGEVELGDLDLRRGGVIFGNQGEDAVTGGLRFGQIAAREDDGGSGAGEFEGGVKADAAVGSGDVRELAVLRGDLHRPLSTGAAMVRRTVAELLVMMMMMAVRGKGGRHEQESEREDNQLLHSYQNGTNGCRLSVELR